MSHHFQSRFCLLYYHYYKYKQNKRRNQSNSFLVSGKNHDNKYLQNVKIKYKWFDDKRNFSLQIIYLCVYVSHLTSYHNKKYSSSKHISFALCFSYFMVICVFVYYLHECDTDFKCGAIKIQSIESLGNVSYHFKWHAECIQTIQHVSWECLVVL